MTGWEWISAGACLVCFSGWGWSLNIYHGIEYGWVNEKTIKSFLLVFFFLIMPFSLFPIPLIFFLRFKKKIYCINGVGKSQITPVISNSPSNVSLVWILSPAFMTVFARTQVVNT